MILEHLNAAINIVQVIIVPLMAGVVTYMRRLNSSIESSRRDLQTHIENTEKSLRRDLQEISSEVRKTNGRLIQVETWVHDHDYVDEMREDRMSREIDHVREDIRHLQTTVIAGQQKDHRP